MMKRILFIFLLVFIQQELSAGITQVSNRMKGAYHSSTNTGGIGTGKTIYLQDDQYVYMVNNPSLWPDVFSNCSHSNRVVLRFEEGARTYYSSPWTLTVDCTLKKWDETGAAITPDETFTLAIDYDPAAGTVYTDKDFYTATDPGYRTELIVGTITAGGSISVVPADIVLETEIEVSRAYLFDQYAAFTGLGHSLSAPDNALSFYWEYMPGIESYDLEWVHVSSYDAVSVASPDFSRATRINTALQGYTINLAYDDGYIAYRIRGVGYNCDAPGFRKEGDWTQGGSLVSISNIDAYRNWQYNAAYAEDGKRKEVITFYDGTGKQRQAVTLSNTNNTAIIGETFYDYEGRPAIQTLPAPDADRNSVLQYYQSFSLVSSSTNQYSRKYFDKDALFDTDDCEWDITPGMDDAQGASNYYSSANASVNIGMYATLPDAKEYPFVQTVYGSDGRPVKQSAPGIDHTIGSAHQVETYYTSPTQEKLDRLFGNEVGYAQHYNQVTVKDPNGQFSVSYLDLSGRTIATALVGEAPDNLDALASNQSISLTESFNNSNIFDASTGTWTVNSFYIVNDLSSDFTFTYEMTPEEFQSICTSQDFDCVYDLKINIYDACNNPVVDNEATHVLGTPYTITYSGGTFTKTFEVTFPKLGVYRIEKILSLNQAALDEAIADFQAALPGTCFASEEDFLDSLNAVLDLSECVGCDSTCVLKAVALGLIGEAKANFIDSCRTHDCANELPEANTCEAMLHALAADLAPGGQYFDNVPDNTAGTPSDSWMTSYVWSNGASAAWTNADFRDPSNNVITNWTDMRTYWQTDWETRTFTNTVTISSIPYNSLAEFHPEYCHYEWCLETTDSKQFDLDLFQSDLYSWASTYPAGGGNAWTDAGGGHQEGINIIDADPYFTTSPGSADYTAMLAQIDVYTGSTSMWDHAGTLAGCTSCNDQWIIFRTLYVSAKAQYMRAQQISGGCGFLCDSNEPPNFYADCSGSQTNGFMIRVPDLVGTLSSTPSSDWATNAGTTLNCHTAASTGYIDIESIIGGASATISTCVEINYGATDITCGIFCGDGSSYTSAQIALELVFAINTCVSSPDFTATINPSDPTEINIYAPAALGSSANGWSLDFVIPSPNPTNTFTLTDGNSASAEGCITAQHCFCQQLYQLSVFYNTINPVTSDYIIDHGLYANGVNEYIAGVLNDLYGTAVDYLDIAAWRESCVETDLGNPVTGEAPELPEEFDCTNPPAPCEEDAYDITDYYAGVFYQQQFEQATEDFIQDYIAHCFGGGFGEDFEVEHNDREYHYTLYYYDQAGNLTRTVPPAGVKLLNSTDITQTNTYRTTGSGSPVYPAHARSGNTMVTNYKYNSFNNLVESSTPDGGTSVFFYDRIGRIVASQNARQAALSNHVYSYTYYDPQGRIYEVGEVESSTTISSTVTATMSAFTTWVGAGTRSQVTSTYYDESLNGTIVSQFTSGQNFLRKRVSTVTIEEIFDNDPDTYDHATHYSYDVHGNVNELIQDYPALADLGQQYKRMEYTYDLISGNVNEVIYQRGEGDGYAHRYYYDADNRVTNVYSVSSSGVEMTAGWNSGAQLWEQDAKYLYYLHGPMARTEIGDKTVQGIDYAYTIHGWIKGVNSNVLDRTKDLGKDGQATNSTAYTTRAGMQSNIATDAYGYALGYYWKTSGSNGKDYVPINSSAQSLYNDVTSLNIVADSLHNGNIKEMSTALSKSNGTGLPVALDLIVNHYHYDQLNRIKSSGSYTGSSSTLYASLSSGTDYQNTFTYDANGNIQQQLRNGNSVSGTSMDSLTYYYWNAAHTVKYTMNADGSVPVNATNQLAYVVDGGTPGNYSDDLESQLASNYTYDEIGQLTGDVSEEINTIDWTVYGKIRSVNRSSGSVKKELSFAYDAMGQRVLKLAKDRDAGTGIKTQNYWTYTYYVRDAQGNVMATYERRFTELSITQVKDEMKLQENHLYGSSRIGIRDRSQDGIQSDVTYNYSSMNLDKSYNTSSIASTTHMAAPDTDTPERVLGHKNYELVNHLGNVLVTLSDRKLLKQQGSSAVIDYFMADVRTTSDYSAFGAPMAGRSFSSSGYRYGFNGKENDAETGTQDYGMRIYNAGLGRFLSVDPISKDYPWYTPYQFAGNIPIRFIDKDGEEPANPGLYDGHIKHAPVIGHTEWGDDYNWIWVNNQWTLTVIEPGFKDDDYDSYDNPASLNDEFSSNKKMNGIEYFAVQNAKLVMKVYNFLMPGGAITWGSAHSSADASGRKLSEVHGRIITNDLSEIEFLAKQTIKEREKYNPVKPDGYRLTGNIIKAVMKPGASDPKTIEDNYLYPSLDGIAPMQERGEFVNGYQVWSNTSDDSRGVPVFNYWISKNGDWIKVDLDTKQEIGVWNKTTGKVDPLPESSGK